MFFFFIIPLVFASRDENSIDLNEERHFLSEGDSHDEKMRVFFLFTWVREKGGARSIGWRGRKERKKVMFRDFNLSLSCTWNKEK